MAKVAISLDSDLARHGAPYGSGPGKARWAVEGTSARLRQFERLRIRHQIRADLHQALRELACVIICLRR
ncbi:hypothetical protein ACWIG5_22380 [Streptomyces lydicus]